MPIGSAEIKKIVDLHEGDISVFNTPEGITIQLKFTQNIRERCDARISKLSNLLLSFTAETMNLGKCSLMLIDDLTGKLVIKDAIGFDKNIISKTGGRIEDGIAGKVLSEKKPLLIEDTGHHHKSAGKSPFRRTKKSLLCLPIFVNSRVKGVLNLNNPANGLPFDKKDLYFASAISERISHVIEKVQKEDMTESEFRTAVRNLETLLLALRRHKRENGELSSIIMRMLQHMQRSEDEVKQAVYSSAFYDLGLSQIDGRILMKSGELSPSEEKIIKTHPFPSARLIDYMEADSSVKKTILHHHERYDGLGYPAGLKGNRIPFLSRVLGVADAYTAMAADRPYRKAFTPKEAVVRIKAGAGKQFDPHVVDAFLKII